MTLLLLLPLLSVGLLMALLFAAVCPRRNVRSEAVRIGPNDESARQHATYFGVIRQAMSAEDFDFLATRAPLPLVRRAHRERQRIAVLYLSDLRDDFERLLRLARVVAVLSPQVAASHELERMRLSVRFCWRYRMVLLGLRAGFLFLPQLHGLNQMVGELAYRMETAMRELGERAVIAAELATSLDNRGLNLG